MCLPVYQFRYDGNGTRRTWRAIMPAAEIAAAVQSVQVTFGLAKAAIGLRDAELFRTRSVELNGLILEALEKSIAAREAEAAQLQKIGALEAEVADLKAWGAEKQNYELKQLWLGGMTYMLKPEARGTEPPHWLCPQCYTNGEKSFFQPSARMQNAHRVYVCAHCKSEMLAHGKPEWEDAAP
jgi:hypothetical protein